MVEIDTIDELPLFLAVVELPAEETVEEVTELSVVDPVVVPRRLLRSRNRTSLGSIRRTICSCVC